MNKPARPNTSPVKTPVELADQSVAGEEDPGASLDVMAMPDQDKAVRSIIATGKAEEKEDPATVVRPKR